jgi:hypothetical protein
MAQHGMRLTGWAEMASWTVVGSPEGFTVQKSVHAHRPKARGRIDTSSSDRGVLNCTSLLIAGHANSHAAASIRASLVLAGHGRSVPSEPKNTNISSRDLAFRPRFDATTL